MTKRTSLQQLNDPPVTDLFPFLREMAEVPPVSNLIALAAGPWSRPSSDLSQIVADLEPWWIFRALRIAAEQNAAEDYKFLLLFLLKKLGIEPPDRVLVASPAKRGRPKKQEEKDRIIRLWGLLGKPKTFSRDLAKAVYGHDYFDGDAMARKRLRDRCGRVIEDHLRRSG